MEMQSTTPLKSSKILQNYLCSPEFAIHYASVYRHISYCYCPGSNTVVYDPAAARQITRSTSHSIYRVKLWCSLSQDAMLSWMGIKVSFREISGCSDCLWLVVRVSVYHCFQFASVGHLLRKTVTCENALQILLLRFST